MLETPAIQQQIQAITHIKSAPLPKNEEEKN